MRALATVVLSLLLGVGVCGPAVADLPSSVHRGQERGIMTAEWGRVLCASSSDAVKCVVRVPGGVSSLYANARQGSEHTDMKTWPYPRIDRVYAKPQRTSGAVVPGVWVSCESRGNQVSCVFRLDGRFAHVRVVAYASGENLAGMDGMFTSLG
jgi:hypothetical protein